MSTRAAKKQQYVLVTGGPTRAFLDEVRFITNVSTGAVAYELCKALRKNKFRVLAVVGPSSYNFEKLKIHKLTRVETNEEMLKAVSTLCKRYRPAAAVFSAAVLDFVPSKTQSGKFSSKNSRWEISLRRSLKIIDWVGTHYPQTKRIGFKLEPARPHWRYHRKYAESYMKKKGLRALCLNFMGELTRSSHPVYFFESGCMLRKIASRKRLANWIVDRIAEWNAIDSKNFSQQKMHRDATKR